MKQLVLLFCFVSGMYSGLSQSPDINNIDNLAAEFIKQLRINLKETIIIHTSKSYYEAGEQLWFKAYCINTLFNKYSRSSKVLFADLVNDHDSVISQILLNNEGRKTEATMAIPPLLTEGYYWLRAYTKNILSKDSNAIFIQPVYIINNQRQNELHSIEQASAVIASAENSGPPLVSFFPEGGSLIAGANTTVAFRATDRAGRPIDISGYVSDGWDSSVATFKTEPMGLGKFSLNTFKARKYRAHIKWNNKDIILPLQSINPYASQLSVSEQTENNLKIVVALGDSLYKRNKQTYLLAISGDSLCFAGIGRDMYEATIPTSNFPPGMAQLLLFNEEKDLVSERAIYIQKESQPIVITAGKQNYGSREKATIALAVTDGNKHPVMASLSLSVTDDSFIKQERYDPLSTLSYSAIDLPRTFLEEDQLKQTPGAWDLIMLTQPPLYSGWKITREPKSIPADTTIDGISDFFSINGVIVNAKKEPVARRVVTLFGNKQVNVMETDTTNEQGRFHFHLVPFADSTEFTLQASDARGVKVNDKIKVDKNPFPIVATPVSKKRKFSRQQQEITNEIKLIRADSLALKNGKEWLKEVVVRGTYKNETNFTSSRRVSHFSYVITGEMMQKSHASDAGNALFTVPGVNLQHGYLVIGGPRGSQGTASPEPLLVVDGVPTLLGGTDGLDGKSPLVKYLTQIPAEAIEFIEVLSGPEGANYGTRGANGVILVNTTNQPGIGNTNESTGLLKYYPNGYHVATPFTMPDYDSKEFKKASFKDNRSVIYRNGNILTGEDGKAVINFFTADRSTTYTITVMGFANNGKFIYKKATISRK